ncbi:hypothetical protein [Luteibacter sp. Lutesp34]|uniref:hypothetical protein n=1 Tax=Luteibacter sp. Lutesp34 TaxID=3243030 RepID=UPI0039B3D8EF
MSASGIQVRPPVVITFNGDDLVETFGDLAYFTHAEDSESLLRSLCDLLVGQGDAPPLLRAVELSSGRYADVHVVPEGDLRHLVLLDATAGVLEARQLQQMKYDALLSGLPPETEEEGLDDVRARLDAMTAHASVLASYCAGEPEALRAIGHIRRTSVYLEARLLGDARPGTPSPVALDRLIDELTALFDAEGDSGLLIDLAPVASHAVSAVVNYSRVQRLLVMLITLSLDAAEGGGVEVHLDTPGGDLLIAIDVPAAPVRPAIKLGLQTCRRLVQSMGGQFGIELDEADATLSRLRVLLPQ